ncbi:S8 family serine peptidase [Kineosporia sp. J2-2]|uniref:S8 family serine peptidase n=1 Tax=Kineosporia corallincola TaxID=2835133 RepID=A0ABS5TG41_9ACTN|nr:S8 family serine peptidase [Kineosporia corallincola]MBT0769823.1 S8 family serine peptidase [Kineosporia corallincola]
MMLLSGITLGSPQSASATAGTSAVHAAQADATYLKYYTVLPSYAGAPERLDEIAQRLLGSAGRAIEIYDLNVARSQEAGGALSDADTLTTGWKLVLPWDAVGDGVQYGLLTDGTITAASPPADGSVLGADTGESTKTAAETSETGSRDATTGAGSSTAEPSASSSGAAAASTAGVGTTRGGNATVPGQVRHCPRLAAAGQEPEWARTQIGMQRAWSYSKGAGQLVAVIDSGVDGSVKALAGHVSVGTNVVSGQGLGDIDCLGTGTAMGSIIAAQPSAGAAWAGVAPDATVMPIRVTVRKHGSKAEIDARAISEAVSAGATVIALGSYVDTSEVAVVAAIEDAVADDVVVVAGAQLETDPADGRPLPTEGVVQVGGIDEKGSPIAEYRSSSIQIVAPGADVHAVGRTGTPRVLVRGTQYAVAFAAGEAALIRAAFPHLDAAGVARQMLATARHSDETGLRVRVIDPFTALTRAPVVMSASTSSAPSSANTGVLVRIALALVLLGVLILLIAHMLRTLQAPPEPQEDPAAPKPNVYA